MPIVRDIVSLAGFKIVKVLDRDIVSHAGFKIVKALDSHRYSFTCWVQDSQGTR